MTRRSPLATLSFAAGTLPGAALGAAAAAAGLLRRTKPLHPVGRLGFGHLTVTVPDPGLGVPLLAHQEVHRCEVRWSKALGLPSGLPDIEGLALRVAGAAADGGDADLLFASTGDSAWSRYLLTVRAPGRFGSLTTLLPVRAGGRPVTFRVAPVDDPADDGAPPSSYALEVARGVGRWRPVGRIDIDWSDQDTGHRFDPVTNELAGIEQYALVTSLREPAYVAARAVTKARRRTTPPQSPPESPPES